MAANLKCSRGSSVETCRNNEEMVITSKPQSASLHFLLVLPLSTISAKLTEKRSNVNRSVIGYFDSDFESFFHDNLFRADRIQNGFTTLQRIMANAKSFQRF